MDYARFIVTAAATVALATQAACNMPNPAFGLDTDTEAGSAGSVSGGSRGGSATASSGMSGTGSGTGTSGTSTSAGTAPTMTTGVTTLGTTGGTSFGSTGGVDTGVATAGTTGGAVCALPPPAGEVDVLTAFGMNAPQNLPGGSINVKGNLTAYDEQSGYWQLVPCSMSEPCGTSCVPGQTPQSLVFKSLPAGGWGPPAFNGNGECFTATMYWNGDGSFQGGAIWQMEEGGILSQDPVWVARGVGPEPLGFGQLSFTLDPKPVDMCACEGLGCCALEPGTYKLKASGSLVLDGGQSLAAGASDTGTLSQTPIRALNVTSVVEPACGASERFTWIVKEDG